VRVRLTALLLAGAITPVSGALASGPPRPVAAPAGFGVQLLGTAADVRKNPLARVYIVGRLARGASTSRRIEISNSTRSTVVVAVYPAAASFHGDSFAFASGHSSNELSRWTTVSRGVLRVPPGGRAFDTVTVKVPNRASSGERYAVVWAEMSTPAHTGGVRLVNRVGVRMYLLIGHGGATAANFAIGSPSGQRSASGQPLVVASVRNSGRSTLAISGELTLSNGPGGLRAGPFPVRLEAVLAPGDKQPLTVRLNRILPRGPWRAEIRLTSGTVERTAEATIRFPRAAEPLHRRGQIEFDCQPGKAYGRCLSLQTTLKHVA